MTLPRGTAKLHHPDLPDVSVLSRIADRLKAAMGAERVVVYGSVARGGATRDSDIDLLIIAPTDAPPYWRMARAREAVRDLSVGLPISPLVLTPDEAERRLGQGDAFLRDIERHGVEL
jgi:uncharacterized protein